MSEDVLGIVWVMIVLSGVLTMTTAGFFLAWQRERRERAARIEQTLTTLGVRLETLSDTVDTIHLEVERIGELERFATKFLIANGQRAGEGRVNTPH